VHRCMALGTLHRLVSSSPFGRRRPDACPATMTSPYDGASNSNSGHSVPIRVQASSTARSTSSG
jgi:hypothetical protein